MKFNNSLAGENCNIYPVLYNFFDKHSANDADAQLAMLLHSFSLKEPYFIPSSLQVANMVFFVTNVQQLISNVAFLDLTDDTGLDPDGEETKFIVEFYNEFGWTNPNELLADALQSWLHRDDCLERSLLQLAGAIVLFGRIQALIETLELAKETLELKGGAQC